MATTIAKADISRADEDSYSIIERLADAIRFEDDTRVTPQDRMRIVQDLWEGPRKCGCCINWVDQVPDGVDLDADGDGEDGEDGRHPLILRHRVTPGEESSRVSIHSIEIRNAEVRKVLFDVFNGLDGIVSEVKYLIFLAPFRPFFWRWDRFERAIADQENDAVREILVQLRAIVKAELAEAFAVTDELVSHGIITYKYIWTIFPPGEIVYSTHDYSDRFYVLTSSTSGYRGRHSYALGCDYVDWDGYDYGMANSQLLISAFSGTRSITELRVVPAKYVKDLESIKTACIERGRRFCELTGAHYKSYRGLEKDATARPTPGIQSASAQFDRRIMLDAQSHPVRAFLSNLVELDEIRLSTGLITQAPVNATPQGGHRPLGHPPYPPRPRRHYIDGGSYDLPVVERYDDFEDPVEMLPPVRRTRARSPVRRTRPWKATQAGHPRHRRSFDSLISEENSEAGNEDEKAELTDWQLQLCNSRMLGYCLKAKGWRTFDVDRIQDIEWNTSPFESLVLPDGYKDLILSFVESQLKDGESFDDVINGKGGGLVILLAGDPGVGKTLTAESVAEKIQAPLYKMELGQLHESDRDCCNPDPEDSHDYERRREDDQIVTAFDLAAKWKAVLLVDECDMFLEKRSDASPKRNRIVSRFLQELEYYPSLLFLTTNREKVLDPAIYSRIHLTINYPALDLSSRRTIWQTFLGRESSSTVSSTELDALAGIDVNGRRIRNIVKSARTMAKQAGRNISFDDVKKVMRITEGITVECPCDFHARK